MTEEEETAMTATASTRPITEREIGAAQLRVTLDEIRGDETPQWIQDLARSRTDASSQSPSPDDGDDPAGAVPSIRDLEVTRDRLSKDATPAVRSALQEIFDNAVQRMTLTASAAGH